MLWEPDQDLDLEAQALWARPRGLVVGSDSRLAFVRSTGPPFSIRVTIEKAPYLSKTVIHPDPDRLTGHDLADVHRLEIGFEKGLSRKLGETRMGPPGCRPVCAVATSKFVSG